MQNIDEIRDMCGLPKDATEQEVLASLRLMKAKLTTAQAENESLKLNTEGLPKDVIEEIKRRMRGGMTESVARTLALQQMALHKKQAEEEAAKKAATKPNLPATPSGAGQDKTTAVPKQPGVANGRVA